MAKFRIFQIAKELNISHTDILSFLRSKKIQVSSHMSPIDEDVHKIIMEEFAKDKEQVERFRKEQVRKEIHDERLKEQQKATKKLKLLSLKEQRELEKKEIEKKAKADLEEKNKKDIEEKRKIDEANKRKQEADRAAQLENIQ